MIKIINRKKNSSKIGPSRGRKKTSSSWLLRFLIVLFAATIAYTLFFSGFLTITEIKISGLDKLEEAPIRNIVNERVVGKYLNLVQKDNLVLFPARILKKELAEKFKRIESVQIKRIFPDRIGVVVEEKKFAMQLCSSDQCYILSDKGETYLASDFSAEELEKENLVTLKDLSGAQISGEVVPLESDFQDFILKLGDQIESETELVIKRQYETPSRMSGDLKVETEGGWKIYLSEDIGLDKELLMLRTVLERKISKDQQKDLEYIDLRIANKVFYKFKEGTVQTQEAENVSVPEVKKEEKKKKK